MSNLEEKESKLQIVESQEEAEIKEEPGTSGMSGDRPQKRAGRRPGRRSSKMDVRAKLERSRQSARECRARKKLRYQYLEDLVANREKAVFALRDELEMYKQWCIQMDSGLIPMSLLSISDNGNKELGPGAKKKQQIDKTFKNSDIITSMTSSNASSIMDSQSASISLEPEAINRYKGSNSSASLFSKGDNLFDHSQDSAAEGTDFGMDDFEWRLNGDIISIVPKSFKNPVLKGSNSVLPTIVEEAET